MKAAVLNAFGSPLAIETLPDPVLGTGEVIVDVVAAGIAGYAASVFSGARNYMLELPVAPGAGGIGRVRATGPDATKLKVGDWVFCDPTVRSRDDAVNPDTILQGWTYRTDAALPLHRFYHHGSFAEQMLVPTENVTPIGDIDAADAGRWCGAQPAAGALRRPAGRRSARRRDAGGERRHRRLRRRRCRRGAGDGRRKGGGHRPQRGARWMTWSAASARGCGRLR